MKSYSGMKSRIFDALRAFLIASILTVLFCLTPTYRSAEHAFFDLRLRNWRDKFDVRETSLQVYSFQDSSRRAGIGDEQLLELFEMLEEVGVRQILVTDSTIFKDFDAVQAQVGPLVEVLDPQELEQPEIRASLFLPNNPFDMDKYLDSDGNLRGLPWDHPAVRLSLDFRGERNSDIESRGPELMLMPAEQGTMTNQVGGGNSPVEYLYQSIKGMSPQERTQALDTFQNKVVMIERSTTEAGNFAEVSTAEGNLTAGQVLLRLQASLEEGWTTSPIPWSVSIPAYILLGGGLCFLLTGRKPVVLAVVGYGCVLACWGISFKLVEWGIDGPIFALLLALFLCVTVLVVGEILRSRHFLRSFGGAEDAQFEGEESEASMVFTNLPPFLMEMERNNDSALLEYRRDYNQILAKVAQRYHGKVLDYQGDAQMLGFGLRHDDDQEHAAEATSAALEIVARVAELAEKWKADPAQLKVHVGVCTGTIALGHLGAEQKQDIAAIGDTTNTAARLMGAAMKNDVPVLVAKSTFETAAGAIEGLEREPVSLKGKSKPVEVYAVLGVDAVWQEANRAKQKDLVPAGGTLDYRGDRMNDLVVTTVVGFVAVLFAIAFWRDGVFDESELRIYDFIHRQIGFVEADSRIVLVGIDEASMADESMGPFPWGRGVYGQAIRNLKDSGYAGLFIDVMFKSARASDPEGDASLAAALADDPRVVIAGVLTDENSRLVEPQIFPAADFDLLRERYQIGLIHSIEGADGIARDGYLAATETASHDTDEAHLRRLYPSASSALLLDPGDRFELLSDEVRLGDREIEAAVDKLGKASTLIRFGPGATASGQAQPGSYSRVSFRRLLNPSDPIFGELKGKYLFVGQTIANGPGAEVDRVKTIAGDLKGVEVHARLFDSLLNDNYVRRVPLSLRKLALWLVAATTVLILTRYREPKAYISRLVLLVATLGLMYVGAFAAFGVLGEILIYCSTVLFVSAAVLVVRHVVTFRALTRVVPAEVAYELLFNRVARDRRQVATVLLTDIRGYTTLSEGRTAVAMLDVLNEYHKRTVACYDRYGGQALTYQGDAQIVVFGVFGNRSNPAADAVQAALELQAICDQLREEWGIESRDDFDVGAGLCTGEVEVGMLGGATNLQYSVVGETVRKAHKVQSLSTDLEAPVILDEETFLASNGKVQADDLGLVQPQGLSHKIRLYRAVKVTE